MQALMVETAGLGTVCVSRLRPSAQDGAGLRRASAALASAALHAAMVGALCLTVARLRPAPTPPASVAMVFEAPSAAPLSTIASGPLAPAETTETTALTHVLPGRAMPALVADDRPRRTRAALAPPAAIATAPAAPVATPSPSAGDLAGLKLRIREAVRAATVYPAVARQMHREGRAQIAFAYVDGAVQDVSLIQSSRSGLLDEAALSAVRRAAYPRPLPGMSGVRLALEVWVNFGLETE